MNKDPKRMAAAVLALSPPGAEDRGGDPPDEDELVESGESDTEEAALDAASEEILAAVEAKDPAALKAALRSAFRSMRR